MRLKWLIANAIIVASGIVYGQNYRMPMDLPLNLSGSFGELRPNHFHTGLDIRTQGRTGQKVFSVDNGYLQRVSVSPTGYGNMLYISHPNGQTSCYGHLESFAPPLDSIIRQLQYNAKSFRIDHIFKTGAIKIGKGQLIAYSGNTGSSGGPHLHFEIRDTESEHALDPAAFGFQANDKRKPTITAIKLYPMPGEGLINGKSTPLILPISDKGGYYKLSVSVWGKIAIGFSAVDYVDGNTAKCAYTRAELKDENGSIFKYNTSQIAFDESRYINANIDYAELMTSGKQFIYTFKANEINNLSNVEYVKNNGILNIDEEKFFNYALHVYDSKGNRAEALIALKGEKKDIAPVEKKEPEHLIRCNLNQEINFEDLHLEFPAGTVYNDLDLELAKGPKSAFLSPVYTIHNTKVPLAKNYFLHLPMPEVKDISKVYLAAINSKGVKSGGYKVTPYRSTVVAAVNTFGRFALTQDNTAPSVQPINFVSGKNYAGTKSISFRIGDGESGIDTYEGAIDGEWALFELDGKTRTIRYTFDKSRLQKGKKHTLEINVTDNCGNTKSYKAGFIW